MLDVNEFMNDDGSFIEGADIRSLAGPGHEETKCFDDIKDFSSLVKVHADTKSALGKKLENVIQKPGEKATDDERAAYKTALREGLGAPKSGAEYEFTRPELPAGMQYDEEFESGMRETLAQAGVPKDEAKVIYDAYNTKMIERFNKHAETEAAEIKAGDEKLRAEWPGEKMTVNTRMAYAAMQALGAKAFPELWSGFKDGEGKDVPGLEQRLKEAVIFDSPGDLDKWRACGVDTSMLKLYSVIGEMMQPGQVLVGDGVGKSTSGISDAEKARINADNAGSPGMQIP